MIDRRLENLGDIIVMHSCKIQKGENVLIEASIQSTDLVKYLLKKCYEIGANPFVIYNDMATNRIIISNCNEKQLEIMKEWESAIMDKIDSYIEIRGFDNTCEMFNVPAEKNNLYWENFYGPVQFGLRGPNHKWVTLNYPTPAMAQKFKMNTDDFEEYFFSVCTTNYKEMAENMIELKKAVDSAKKMTIKKHGYSLEIGIGAEAYICAGEINIPDGELFFAPKKYEVNGTILFDTPCLFRNLMFKDIKLTFKDGKVVEASSSNYNDKLNDIVFTDEGSCYLGEVAFGTNPNVDRIVDNILFDEKMLGSIHIALGDAHVNSDNGNRSTLHWDIVQVHKESYGGGEIYLDDKLIMKDGIFIPNALQSLNVGKKNTK